MGDDDKDYKELPLVSTGCDSYASWDVKFKHLSPMMSIEQIVDRFQELLPGGKFGRDKHLIITGGEPLLGWQRCYPDLLDHDQMKDLKEITFETNGTQELTDEFRDYLLYWQEPEWYGREVTFSVSAKLPCSGEKWEDAIRPEVVRGYQDVGYVYLKFVVATPQDVQDAVLAVHEFTQAGVNVPVYLMPVGGVESVYTLNNKSVALEAMKLGYRYSDRLQVPLFKNEWGT